MTSRGNESLETEPAATLPEYRTRGRRLFRWVRGILAVVGLSFIVWHLCFELVVMTTDSMSPTLRGTSYEDGDRIVVEHLTRWFRSPKRWEVCFLIDSEGTPVAKRIVGLPGEKISLKQNRLYADGAEIPRPSHLKWLKYYDYGNLRGGKVADCGRAYYVMGDDSRDSYDSRFLGAVAPEQFRGRVWCIVWPPSRFGLVR